MKFRHSLLRRAFAAACLLAVSAMALGGPMDVRVITLSNGFTVWLNEDHSQPKVFGAVVVRAGAKDCPGSGIAHYFEHLMFKGTDRIGTIDYAAEKPYLDSISWEYDRLARTRDAQLRRNIQRRINQLSVKAADYAIPNEFNSLITAYGGTRLNAYTSFDETVYHNYFSPQFVAQWCQLNSDRLINPVFRLFQSELETVYEEKNMYSDNMISQAAEATQRYALQGTPYASPIVGETDSLKNPRLSEMMQFFHKYYTAQNMALILSGDIKADTLAPLLERTFGRLPQGSAPEAHAPAKPALGRLAPFEVKLPIPIVKARGYGYLAPQETDSDYVAFKVMLAMLYNGNNGMLDSLVNDSRMLMAMAGSYDFKDFSAFAWGFVPTILGSKTKAERLCRQQIDRLKEERFSDEAVEAQKLLLMRQREEEMESVDGRSMAMIQAFSHGIPWERMLRMADEIGRVSRQDIVRVARRFFNADALQITKTFGGYPKDHVAQPGYRPVRPKNAGRQSEYARQLAQMPVADVQPRLVDFSKDARQQSLAPLVNLYTVSNTENDVFSLELRYRFGAKHDRRVSLLADYLNDIGTERWTKNELAQQLSRVGAQLEADATNDCVSLTLTGFDGRFAEAVSLLQEFVLHPKADERRFKDDIVDGTALERQVLFRDNASIAEAVVQKVALGDSSAFLKKYTTKELKRMGGTQLVNVFKNEVRQSQLDIIYSGGLPDDSVQSVVSRCLPINMVSRPWRPVVHELQPVSQPTVYVFDNPDARQTIVAVYQTVDRPCADGGAAPFRMWGQYFGGGMSSMLFQEVREFRSMAYSASGQALLNDPMVDPNGRGAYVAMLATQQDKAAEALQLLDSLLNDMPVREGAMQAARQAMANTINNGFPSFRQIGGYVADKRLLGYDDDPNRMLVATLADSSSVSAIQQFYNHNIRNANRAIIIVGNLRNVDFSTLARYGAVVMLDDRDIYRF